jgi:acyl-ACP thioesterase
MARGESTNKRAVWTQNYDVNTIVLNHRKRLGLVGLLSLLQDTAWVHARHLGHGFDAMIERGTIWVLTRQKLAMSAWPGWGDSIAIRTWLRPIAGALAYRDYEIVSGGRIVGECTACWLTLDAETRRPLRLNLTDTGVACRSDGGLAIEPGKIAPRQGMDEAARFEVRNSDLDVNGHVNNTRYAQWILDSVPLETHATYRLQTYEVNFLAETQVGDTIVIDKSQLDPAADSLKQWQFQGRRAADDKVAFAARLGVEAAES